MIASVIAIALVCAGAATGLECLAHGRYADLFGAACAVGIGLMVLS